MLKANFAILSGVLLLIADGQPVVNNPRLNPYNNQQWNFHLQWKNRSYNNETTNSSIVGDTSEILFEKEKIKSHARLHIFYIYSFFIIICNFVICSNACW